jgi:hypothetical protein
VHRGLRDGHLIGETSLSLAVFEGFDGVAALTSCVGERCGPGG